MTPSIYTLSLHDALPIFPALWIGQGSGDAARPNAARPCDRCATALLRGAGDRRASLEKRSEEHTSELQSREKLVCRLLPEKKKHRRIRTSSRSFSQRLDH